MKVYIDVIFGVNTAVNFLLLILGSRLCAYRVMRLRTLIAAALGGVYAVLSLLPPLAFLASVPGKIISFLLMAAIAYGVRRAAIRPAALALVCSAALAGVMVLVSELFSFEFIALDGTVYYPVTARALVLTAGIFYAAAAWIANGSVRHRKEEIEQLELSTPFGKITVTAFVDTGNTLTDPLTGEPVLVLDWGRGAELLGVHSTVAEAADPVLALQNFTERCPGLRFRLIPYGAVGAGGLLMAFPCTAKKKHGKKRKILTALSPTPLSAAENYEALIGGSV